MKNVTKGTILFVAALLLLGGGLWRNRGQKREVVISIQERVQFIFSDNGFSPSFLTVAQGMVVTFQNNSKGPVWPASDSHPTHEMYPEFDSKKTILSGQSWLFRFDREGEWKFHDHINPKFTGVIVVGQKERTISVIWTWLNHLADSWRMKKGSLAHTCDSKRDNRGQFQQCWKDLFIRIVQYYGVDQALSILERTKNEDLLFASDCHPYAHQIGEEAYVQYTKGVKFKITSDTATCDLGFYHGFMQEYASHGKNLADAKEFCEYIDKNARDVRGDLGVMCFHGIGHGLTFKYAVEQRGDESEILDKAIEDCKNILKEDFNDANYSECVNGSFGGVAALYFTLHGFRLNMSRTDPFWVCKNRPILYQRICYDSMIPPLFMSNQHNVVETGKFVSAITDKEGAETAMLHLGSMPTHVLDLERENFDSVIRDCAAVASQLVTYCINGFANGLLRVGEARLARKRAVRFCNSTILSGEEKHACYGSIIQRVRVDAGVNELQSMCREIDSAYRLGCE